MYFKNTSFISKPKIFCSLAEKGHQVIYTTHSDKMVDLFDTRGLIRLEIEKNHTIKKYNDPDGEISDKEGIVNLKKYNEFIKTVEPNLNKILFSKKVIRSIDLQCKLL